MFVEVGVVVTGIFVGVLVAAGVIVPAAISLLLVNRYVLAVARAASKSEEEWKVTATNAIIRSHIQPSQASESDDEDFERG